MVKLLKNLLHSQNRYGLSIYGIYTLPRQLYLTWRLRDKMKKNKEAQLIVNTKDEGIAVFSYDGIGLAVRIGDHTIEEVFDEALKSIKKYKESLVSAEEEEKT